MSSTTTFVFGGASPIAIATSIHMNQFSQVVHFSRNVNQECFDQLKRRGIILEEVDLHSLCDSPDLQKQMENKVEKYQPTQTVFSQRNKTSDLLQGFKVEVVATNLILQMLALVSDPHPKVAVLLTSPAASFVQESQPLAYHVIKAAQLQLARYYAANFKQFKIRVNSFSPGAFVEKERSRIYYENNKDLVAKINRGVPIGRFARMEDITHIIDFMLGEKSSYLNGQELLADGGLSILDQSIFLMDN